MAEYYGIYDYRKHSALYIATLAYGLPESSRSRMNLNDTKATFEQLMLASISDSLAWLKWSKTKNAQNGLDMPSALGTI